jgi:hypothetical protein
MKPAKVVVADSVPLIALARLGALDSLFRDDTQVVVTDYAEFEATRRHAEDPDAAAVLDFLSRNSGRVEIERTEIGESYKTMFMLAERLAKDPQLAAELGLDAKRPADPGDMSIVDYIRSLGATEPVLMIVDDDYFLREILPLPENIQVVSTSAFINDRPHRSTAPAASTLSARR